MRFYLKVLARFGLPLVALPLLAGQALAQAGVIRGTIDLAGAAPSAEAVPVTKDQDYCGETVPSHQLIVSEGRVQNAVVHIELGDGVAAPSPKADKVAIANHGCVFDPPVLVASAGSIIEIGNDDRVLHNTHLRHGRRTVANLGLPNQGDRIENSRALRRPGLVEVECDAHDWMTAKIWVFDHPLYALTDASGAFEISGVPAGTHTLHVWHEVLGEVVRTVTVEGDATTEVPIVLPEVGAAAPAPGNR